MGATYGWLITHDSIRDDDAPEGTNSNAKSVSGPYGLTKAVLNRLVYAAGIGKRRASEVDPDVQFFRMYDDDGELYYTGVYLTTDDDSGFEPLDDFGTPNAGATEIRYYRGIGRDAKEVWETL
ncbi:MAG TPA: hypothetical protein VFE08_14470 [Candidatus Sulfotelmatobacter sp.]|jgi:hypothetical protein|nr:hypothetical protein [Candidatus Sulfotelmatobacter sp.]